MTHKAITPTEYAKAKGCTVGYIRRMLKDEKELPHVQEVMKFGRFYTLKVPADFSKKYFTKKKTA